jgi:hypothetical protein
LFEVFRSAGAPELLLAACQATIARDRDVLPLYALLAWSLHTIASGVTAESVYTLAEPELIDGIPDYAFDPHHTRTGRRAVELWRRSYLTPPPWTARQIGMALWNIEAASCDRRLKWPLGEEIRRQAYRADLLAFGVPQEQQDALYLWILQELPALACARRAAWRSARPS